MSGGNEVRSVLFRDILWMTSRNYSELQLFSIPKNRPDLSLKVTIRILLPCRCEP